MSNKNDDNNINKPNEQKKEDLLRDLSENFNIDLGEGGNEATPNPQKINQQKSNLPSIPETSFEVSCIMPLKGQKDRFNKNEDSTILNIFGDEDENENLVSFYGVNGDLQQLVNNIDLRKSEPTGFLSVVNFYKIGNEQISKITKTINQNDLIACKRVIDKIEFDEKMITKINDLKYLLMKSKDITDDDTVEILTNKEYLNDLFAWRDILPGDDSFYRSIMFSYIEYLILNNDLENYKTFIYD